MRYFLSLLPFLFLSLFSSLIYAEVTVIPMESGQIFFDESMRLRESGEVEKAERYMKRALEIEPANADFRFELANIYAIRYDRVGKQRVRDANQQMLEYSARELEQAIMLNPDFLQAHFNLGVVRKKQGHYEAAREKFRHVLEIQPDLVNAHLQIAAIYEDQGFFDDAKDAYMKAQDLDYGNQDIREAISDLKVAKKQDRDRMLAELHRDSIYRSGQPFGFSPNSKAREYESSRYQSIESGYGIQEAVPYLTMWLVDQFMKIKNE